jgi:hypothetical protein
MAVLVSRPRVRLDELRDSVPADVGSSFYAHVIDLTSVDEFVDAVAPGGRRTRGSLRFDRHRERSIGLHKYGRTWS